MGLSFGDISSGNTGGTAATTLTVPITIASGEDYVVAGCGARKASGSGNPTISATLNGVSMTQKGSTLNVGSVRSAAAFEIHHSLSAGTYDIVFTFNVSCDATGGGLSVGGVYGQASGTTATNSGSGTTPTVDVSSVSGDEVFGFLYADNAITFTPGSGQTELWDTQDKPSGAFSAGEGSRETATGTTTTMSATISSSSWLAFGWAIKAGTAPSTGNMFGWF